MGSRKTSFNIQAIGEQKYTFLCGFFFIKRNVSGWFLMKVLMAHVKWQLQIPGKFAGVDSASKNG